MVIPTDMRENRMITSKEGQQFLHSLAVSIIDNLTYKYLKKLHTYIEDVMQHLPKPKETE